MTFINYYKTLGIEKSASAADIKFAYRKLARKYHPDLNPNDVEAKKNFQQINEANEVLSDPVKRAKYDKYGHDKQNKDPYENQYNEQGSDFGRQKYSRTQSGEDFSDFFSSMFGGSPNSGRSRQVKYRGEDFNAQLQINLTDAFKSHKQTLTINGRNIRITIPAGIENGQTIKIVGHGGLGSNGGPNGDLYITFKMGNDGKVKRQGNDLFLTVELELCTAVLGGEITVDTLNGKVMINVQPETQNGTKVKLKGKGFPVYKFENQYGDFYITYTIKLPTHLTERQKDLFIELSKL